MTEQESWSKLATRWSQSTKVSEIKARHKQFGPTLGGVLNFCRLDEEIEYYWHGEGILKRDGWGLYARADILF